MDQALTEDAIGEDIQGQLLFAVKIGCSGDTEIAGTNGVDDIFRSIGNFTNQTGQIAINVGIAQITTQINLKFRFSGGSSHRILLKALKFLSV